MNKATHYRNRYFKPKATVKGVADFIRAKRKSRAAFLDMGRLEEVMDKDDEIEVARKCLWFKTGMNGR